MNYYYTYYHYWRHYCYYCYCNYSYYWEPLLLLLLLALDEPVAPLGSVVRQLGTGAPVPGVECQCIC